jgi:hypothetical protein
VRRFFEGETSLIGLRFVQDSFYIYIYICKEPVANDGDTAGAIVMVIVPGMVTYDTFSAIRQMSPNVCPCLPQSIRRDTDVHLIVITADIFE